MKLRLHPQWHFLAIVAPVVVFAFRAGDILSHRDWSAGRATVLGRIDDIQESQTSQTNVRVVRYSYQVDGKPYKGEVTHPDKFIEGVPVQVTYARGNPETATILPEQIESIYRNSLIIVGVALLPFACMLGYELSGLLRKRG